MLLAVADAASGQPSGSTAARNAQRVEASVTIIAAEPVSVRSRPARNSSQATSRQYRERDKVLLVEFF